jgi:polysaccharide pyruvyl transferase WcaK-like protein
MAGGTLIGNKDNFLARSQRMFNVARHRFVFGTGVADYEFWKDRKLSAKKSWQENLSLWCCILKRCDYVGVRGPQSQKTLLDAGLQNVEVVGDPVLVFADCSKSVNYHDKVLGLNFGFGGEHMWDSQEKLYDKIVELASLAGKSGWKVMWFVVWPKDLPITQSAAKESKTGEHIHEICKDHSKYMDLVSDVTVFVGMKLHAVALATCAGVPSIMLEYRPKCRDYMKSIRQDHLCERIDLFEAEKVWQRVLDIHSSREKYTAKIADGISQLQAFQKQKADLILESVRRK